MTYANVNGTTLPPPLPFSAPDKTHLDVMLEGTTLEAWRNTDTGHLEPVELTLTNPGPTDSPHVEHIENDGEQSKSLGYEGEQIGKHTGMDHGSQNEPNREEVKLVTETSEKGEVLVVPPYPTLNEPTDELQGTALESTDVFEPSHEEPTEYDLPIKRFKTDIPNAVQSEGEWDIFILAPSAVMETENVNQCSSHTGMGKTDEKTNLLGTPDSLNELKVPENTLTPETTPVSETNTRRRERPRTGNRKAVTATPENIEGNPPTQTIASETTESSMETIEMSKQMFRNVKQQCAHPVTKTPGTPVRIAEEAADTHARMLLQQSKITRPSKFPISNRSCRVTEECRNRNKPLNVEYPEVNGSNKHVSSTTETTRAPTKTVEGITSGYAKPSPSGSEPTTKSASMGKDHRRAKQRGAESKASRMATQHTEN
jgi:hypothetical protein